MRYGDSMGKLLNRLSLRLRALNPIGKKGRMEKGLLEARDVTDEMGKEYGFVPEQWYTKETSPIDKDAIPPASGEGFVQSPYSDIYMRLWGVEPIGDMLIYRNMVRNHPVIHAAIQTLVHLTLQKGYQWNCDPKAPKKEIMEEDVYKIFNNLKCDFDLVILPQIVFDLITYGSAFVENLFAGQVKKRDIADIKKGHGIISELDIEDDGELINLKALDPYYMRVSRDAYNNVLGFRQIIAYPPVAFVPSKITHYRYQPTTVSYESAYGTSILQACVRIYRLLRACENDLYQSGHSIVKCPVIYKQPRGEHGENPMGSINWAAIEAAEAARKVGDSILTYGADAEPMMPQGSVIQGMVQFYDRLLEQLIIALGVPKPLLGIPEGSSHTTAMTSWDQLIVKVQGIQQLVSSFTTWGIAIPGLLRMRDPKDPTGKKRKWTYEEIMENLPTMNFEYLSIQDMSIESQRATAEWQAGGISRNEYRESIRRPAIEDETGTMFIEDVMGNIKGGPGGGANVPQLDEVQTGREIRASFSEMATKGLQNPIIKPKKFKCSGCGSKLLFIGDSTNLKCPKCAGIMVDDIDGEIISANDPSLEWDPYEHWFEEQLKNFPGAEA